MANIFEIDEIVRNVLRFCDRKTLGCLARTGKMVSDQALDELWRELESFAYLLKLFPDELISWHSLDDGPRGAVRPVSISPLKLV